MKFEQEFGARSAEDIEDTDIERFIEKNCPDDLRHEAREAIDAHLELKRIQAESLS